MKPRKNVGFSFIALAFFLIVTVQPKQAYAVLPSQKEMQHELKPMPNWGKIIKEATKKIFKIKPKPRPVHPKPNFRPTPPNSSSIPINIKSMNVPIITHDASSALAHEMGIVSSGNSFRVGQKTVYNDKDLMIAISEELQVQRAGMNKYSTHIEVKCEGLGGARSMVIIGDLKAFIVTSVQKLEDFDIDNMVSIEQMFNGQRCTRIIIPRKVTKIYSEVELSRMKSAKVMFDVKPTYADKVKQILKTLFKKGGILTQSRLDRALKEADVPSNAIIHECTTFCFAEIVDRDVDVQFL